jgi:tetratricopeptide (TPR) repeat protein
MNQWAQDLCVARLALLAVVNLVIAGHAQELDAEKANRPLSQIEAAAVPGPRPAPKLGDLPQVDAHCKAARQMLEEQKFAQAVAELDAALSLEGGSCYEVLYLLAQAKRGVGRRGEACLAAEFATLYRPGDVDANLLLGRLHREQRRLDAAIAHFRTATLAAGTEPDNPRVTVAWYELGDCLADAGYVAAAAEAFERFDRALWEEHPAQRSAVEIAAILEQQPYGAIERRLELWRRLERPAELTRTAQWAYQTRPEEPYLERLYVRALLDSGQPGPAFDFCRARLAESPADDPRAAMRLTLAIEAGQAAGRLKEWVAELATDVLRGGFVALAERVAERLDAAKDYALSVALWRPLATARPDDADTAWALASACRESQDLSGALGSLIEFVRRDPERAEISPERLAAWMRSFAATDELLRLIQRLTARDDCDFATYTVLGTAAAAAGQTELAERLFSSALENRPGFALAHLAWARMLLAAYRWDEARDQAEQALSAVPNLPSAQYLLGEACSGLDMNAKAETAYKAALEASPQEITYVLALARHYRRTDNLLAAQRYFQQAWSLGHSNAEAVEELIDCYLDGGKVEIARGILKEAEASEVPDDVLRRIRTALRFAATPMQSEHLAELTRQFAAHPDDVRTGLKLAAGLYLNQRADEALPILQQVQARAPDDERLVYLLARVHLRRLEYQPAIALLEAAARRFPARPAVLRLLADAYLADFRVDETQQTLQRLLTPDLPTEQRNALRGQLINTYLTFSEFDPALELVQSWQAAGPDEDTWPRIKLQILLAAERWDDALALATERLSSATERFDELQQRAKAFSERAESNPDDADTQAQLENLDRELDSHEADLNDRRSDYVQACVDAKRYDTAEQHVRSWLADDPEQDTLQEWLVEVLLAARRGAAALDAISDLTPKTPADVIKVFGWRARGQALSGDLDQGLNDLGSLLEEKFVQENDAARARVREEMLRLLIDAGQYDRAVALCDRWLNGLPPADRAARLGALVLKRMVLSAADRLDEQAGITEELLAARPFDPGLNNDLGYTWIDRGERLERGLAMIKLAVAAEPLNAAYLDSLGWAYYKSGDFAAARLHLARAVRLRSGQDAVMYDHLGDAEYRAGDRNAARTAWQKAVSLLTARETSDAMPNDARLIAAVRGKLSDLAEQGQPAAAPTAAEQAETTQP